MPVIVADFPEKEKNPLSPLKGGGQFLLNMASKKLEQILHTEFMAPSTAPLRE